MACERITAATCRTCGACCVAPHDQDALVEITIKDAWRLGRQFARLLILQSDWEQLVPLFPNTRDTCCGAIRTAWRKQHAGPLRGTRVCACVLLHGSLLHRTNRCSAYTCRPDVCRKAVKPGDRVCRKLRRDLFDLAGAPR